MFLFAYDVFFAGDREGYRRVQIMPAFSVDAVEDEAYNEGIDLVRTMCHDLQLEWSDSDIEDEVAYSIHQVKGMDKIDVSTLARAIDIINDILRKADDETLDDFIENSCEFVTSN